MQALHEAAERRSYEQRENTELLQLHEIENQILDRPPTAQERIRELIRGHQSNAYTITEAQKEFFKLQDRVKMEKEFNELRAIEDQIMHVKQAAPPPPFQKRAPDLDRDSAIHVRQK